MAQISAPIAMTPGVGGKLMPLCRTGAPPRGPVLTQAAVPLLRALVRGKKGNPDRLPFEHLGPKRPNPHVAGIERQIQRLVTVFFCTGAGTIYAASYQYNSKPVTGTFGLPAAVP